MSISDVTPVILTFNEEVNLGRTLSSLRAFRQVVVVDSDSTDRTEEIARSFANVTFLRNRFEGHVAQWRWALAAPSVDSSFVLLLDADMSVTPELLAEIEQTSADGTVDAGLIPVQYCVRGVPLLGSLYPRELRLLRRERATVTAAGHTQKFATSGRVVRLSSPLVHDDRKPLEAFVAAQLGYSARELSCLYGQKSRTMRGRVRRVFPFAPILVWAWAWLRAGGPLRGPAARRYALERLICEALLRWRVEDHLLAGEDGVMRSNGKGRDV